MKALIPNLISLLRILVVAPYAVILYYQPHSLKVLLLAALIVLSDFFDGFLARRWKTETSFGSMVDAISDGAFIFGSLIIFYILKIVTLEALIVVCLPRALSAVSHLIFRLRHGRWNAIHFWGNKISAVIYFMLIASLIKGYVIGPGITGYIFGVLLVSVLASELHRHNLLRIK